MSIESHFSLSFDEKLELPPLAWCMTIRASSTEVIVQHGSGVETDRRCFFEGAWADDYEKTQFERHFMTGSGAKIFDDKIMIATASHNFDRVVSIQKKSCIFLSNSLPYLLSQSGESLSTACLWYDGYWTSIRDGLMDYTRFFQTASGEKVRFHCCCNITIDRGLTIVEKSKPISPLFEDFFEYRNYITSCAVALSENASHASRNSKYAPLSTLSAGYDSTAATVIAMETGCERALTFRDSRGVVDSEDCGTPIAKQLGLDIQVFGRLDYKTFDNYPEVENSGGPNEFLSFGNSVATSLLFTGHLGTTWDKNCIVSSDFTRTDASGASFTEYRLRTGFFHLPIPFIGGDSLASIKKISNSREMLPWSVGGHYDKPIARRIVEEAGVSRETFGQSKHAAGVVVSNEGLVSTMSERSLDDFQIFVEENWSSWKDAQVRFAVFSRVLVRLNERLARYIRIRPDTLGKFMPGFPTLVPRQIRAITYGYLGKEAMLFHWGIDKLVKRYLDASSQGESIQ